MEDDYLMLSGAINSAKSTQVALNSLRLGEAGLNAHRQNLLNRAPVTDSFASFPRDSIEIEDLAYLSAHEDHEFALLRGKKNDILIHGEHSKVNFDEDLEALLLQGKYELIAHSHPDIELTASREDREFLRRIGQKSSVIISWYTGNMMKFYADPFEELFN
ncbi:MULTISPECIES: hypothetical protein [unclassified Butyrivibrio]|uniref:hypothetical protein n=1 Tax=unclassified Butyrivibrio TaxID=2639466 RepID=UPI000402F643|nr:MULTISPECIES: hypothetical protein [unclassified Butyrivibrio]